MINSSSMDTSLKNTSCGLELDTVASQLADVENKILKEGVQLDTSAVQQTAVMHLLLSGPPGKLINDHSTATDEDRPSHMTRPSPDSLTHHTLPGLRSPQPAPERQETVTNNQHLDCATHPITSAITSRLRGSIQERQQTTPVVPSPRRRRLSRVSLRWMTGVINVPRN